MSAGPSAPGKIRSAHLERLAVVYVRQSSLAQVREQQGITCSVGVAPCKFVAKIASARCKPDGGPRRNWSGSTRWPEKPSA